MPTTAGRPRHAINTWSRTIQILLVIAAQPSQSASINAISDVIGCTRHDVLNALKRGRYCDVTGLRENMVLTLNDAGRDYIARWREKPESEAMEFIAAWKLAESIDGPISCHDESTRPRETGRGGRPRKNAGKQGFSNQDYDGKCEMST